MRKEHLIVMFSVPVAVLSVVICFHYRNQVAHLENKVSQLSVELAHAHIPFEQTFIRDSVPVVTQTVVEVAPADMKEALASDAQLIKELQLRIAQLETLQTSVIQTSDTVPASYEAPDSLFYYNDQWADIQLSLKDRPIAHFAG